MVESNTQLLKFVMIKKIKKLTSRHFPELSRTIYHKVNRIKYRGDEYYCPVCENSFRQFLTGPDDSRKNSKCPGCGSLERQRLLWLYLKNKLQIEKQNLSILNIAPDYAIQTRLKKLKNINYLSIDIDSDLAMEKHDLTNLSFANNSFDSILCYHVLEHVEDDKKAMRELLRVLKPKGWAILQTPIDKTLEKTFEDFTIRSPKEREKVFGQSDHVRIYGLDYIERLGSVGFIVTIDNYVSQLNNEEIHRCLIDKTEEIYFCIKP